MLVDIDVEDKDLSLSYFNNKGFTEIKHYELNNITNWCVCSEYDKHKSLKYINWDGRSVKKYRSRFMNKQSVVEFLEKLPDTDKKEIFAQNYPNVTFFDIETEIGDVFPDPRRAEQKINAISVSTLDDGIVVLALQDLSNNEITDINNQINNHFRKFNKNFKFAYRKFESEYDLLYTFLFEYVKNSSLISGWNCIWFDWTYIVNRCKRINIDLGIASPIGKIDSYTGYPIHVALFDYMDIYKKWDKTIDIKENYTLDYTGESVLGVKKIKYEGSLKDLYEKDYVKFIFYNAVDTLIVQLIHEKLRTLEIVLTTANICNISIYKADSPVTVTESLLLRNFLKENKVMAKDFGDNGEEKKGKFEGAYVKAPIVGRHKAVACFDFASLYPSIMRQMNISPDSFLKKVPNYRNYLSEINGKEIVASNGCVFDKNPSILKHILDDLYSKRRKYKNTFWEYELEADHIKKIIEKRNGK